MPEKYIPCRSFRITTFLIIKYVLSTFIFRGTERGALLIGRLHRDNIESNLMLLWILLRSALSKKVKNIVIFKTLLISCYAKSCVENEIVFLFVCYGLKMPQSTRYKTLWHNGNI